MSRSSDLRDIESSFVAEVRRFRTRSSHLRVNDLRLLRAPCAATSIIARRTIQRVGALTARKYARALACACTGWKVGGHATRVAELVRLYVFSIKFPGPRVRAARRLARAAALGSINRRALSLACPVCHEGHYDI